MAPCNRCGGMFCPSCQGECERTCACDLYCEACGNRVSASTYESLVEFEKAEQACYDAEEAARRLADTVEPTLRALLAEHLGRDPSLDLDAALKRLGFSVPCERCGGEGSQPSLDEHERDRGIDDVCYRCCTKGWHAPAFTWGLVEALRQVLAKTPQSVDPGGAR
jgi:hypothetical protein